MVGLLRDREPLLRRSYPNEPTCQGYPEGGAARDTVPKTASARRCGSFSFRTVICDCGACVVVMLMLLLLMLLLLLCWGS